MLPIRRDLRFNLTAERITKWHPAGKHVTHFLNTLSVVFPVGERFFIDSVRYYRDNGTIKDPELLEEMKGFIGQEAMHGREHEDYNDAYTEAGFKADVFEARVALLLKTMQRMPPSFQLAGTIALEHYTAILADGLLDNPILLEGADKDFFAVWNWHALEETEHKSVAYDVYKQVMRDKKLRGYALRTSVMILATIMLWAIVYPNYLRNVQRDGGLFDVKGWATSLKYQFGPFGILRKTFGQYLDYYRPGFHPWDHDNSHFLEQVDAIAEEFGVQFAKAA